MDNDADTQELGSGQWLLVNPISPEPKAEEKVDDAYKNKKRPIPMIQSTIKVLIILFFPCRNRHHHNLHRHLQAHLLSTMKIKTSTLVNYINPV